MDFEKLSAERYSLRKFDTRPVEQEKLNLILEAGRNAPTAHNNQPQRIFVFRSPAALDKAATSTPLWSLPWATIPKNPGTGSMTARTTARSTPPSL